MALYSLHEVFHETPGNGGDRLQGKQIFYFQSRLAKFTVVGNSEAMAIPSVVNVFKYTDPKSHQA